MSDVGISLISLHYCFSVLYYFTDASNGRANTQSSTRQTSVTSTDSNVQENCPNTKTLPKTTDVTAKEIPAASSHSPQSKNSTVNELKSSNSTNAARSQSVPDQTGANNSAPKSSSAEASSPLPLSGANSIHPFQQKDSTVSPKSPAQDKYATDGARKSPTRPNDTPTPRPLLNQGPNIGSVTSPKATQCLTTASSATTPSTTDPSARVPSTTESSTVRTEGTYSKSFLRASILKNSYNIDTLSATMFIRGRRMSLL